MLAGMLFLVLVLAVAFTPWYPVAGASPDVSPTMWQQVTALFGAAEGNTTPTP